jgi:hypothetical protein
MIVSEEGKGEIQLTSEDYLQGVIGMVNELVSFSFYPIYVSHMRVEISLGEASLIPATTIDQFGDCSEL